MKIFAAVVFILTYVALIALPKRRTITGVISAAVFLISGLVPLTALTGVINFNVLLMIGGTMITVFLFIESRMPNRMADILLNHSRNVCWVIIFMSLFSGVISAFVDNVATVLIVAPVALAVAKKLEISPVPMVIAISVSSNLQGAATLVGDATSILLGGYAGMDFLDFFFFQGKISLFWVVELAALLTVPLMLVLFRKERQPVGKREPAAVEDKVPTVLLFGTILLLIAASFWKDKPELTNGVICMAVALAGVLYTLLKKKDGASAAKAFRSIDFQTLILLACMFIVVGGVTEAGIINDISTVFARLGGQSLFALYSLLVWGSVLISAFVDNIPYVATMLPVAAGIASRMGIEPYILYFGLLVGATLGGNLTPVGASANITGIGILTRAGHEVRTRDFMKIGIPMTLTAVMTGYILIWLIWS